MGRKKINDIPKSDFDVNHSSDLMSFDSNEYLGECIMSFDFGNNKNSDAVADIITHSSVVINSPPFVNSQSRNNSSSPAAAPRTLFDNRTTPIANGSAPAIDGETPEVKRTYNLRSSTVRKINELKSIHPNINVCVSTIVDMAVDNYHKYITVDGGLQ